MYKKYEKTYLLIQFGRWCRCRRRRFFRHNWWRRGRMFRRTWQSWTTTRRWHTQRPCTTQSAFLRIGHFAGSFRLIFYWGIKHKLQRLWYCKSKYVRYLGETMYILHRRVLIFTWRRTLRVSGIVQRGRRTFKQSTPSRDINVHLICSWEIFHLLLKDLALTLQFRLSRYHRI